MKKPRRIKLPAEFKKKIFKYWNVKNIKLNEMPYACIVTSGYILKDACPLCRKYRAFAILPNDCGKCPLAKYHTKDYTGCYVKLHDLTGEWIRFGLWNTKEEAIKTVEIVRKAIKDFVVWEE